MLPLKRYVISLIMVVVCVLISTMLLWIRISFAEDITYTEYEIIRNGDFEQDRDGWHAFWTSYHNFAAKDGDYGWRLDHLGESHHRYAFQKLLIPTEVTAAAIRFDYRVVDQTYYNYSPIVFEVSVGTSKGFDSENLEVNPPLSVIGVIHTETIEGQLDWKTHSAELSPSLIDAIQTAHDAGEFVFLMFSQSNTNREDDPRLITDIDNLSFTVSGTQRIPALSGKIAYLEDNDEDQPHALNTIDPNTNAVETIWTHPGEITYAPREVAWRPDATEIAFSSDHEHLSSPFGGDIYAVKPDGSSLRKITGPSQAAINDSNLPRVTVNGVVNNVYGGSNAASRNVIIVTIQGVEDGRMLVAEAGASVSFSIPDVPVLGDPNTFTQPITMTFTNPECSGGIEYHFPNAIVGSGSVDLGTINFYGLTCFGQLGSLVPRDLTWRHDGSQIGFRMLGFKKVPSTFSNAFEWTRIEPDGGVFGNSFTWSPVDDRYLYWDHTNGTEPQLYVAEEGGEPKWLLDDKNDWTKPAWLPDGSGFIYIGQPAQRTEFNDNIFYYDLTTGTRQRLTYFSFDVIENLSISANGQYIVFEMRDTVGIPYNSDLWIMDRFNPANIWRITNSGNCTKPDWSRTDVPSNSSDDEIDPNDNDEPDESNNNDDSGGGGGCFIFSCLLGGSATF